MRFGRSVIVVLLSAALVCGFAIACSSVPDVTYGELDGSREGAGDQRSEPIPRPQYACPNKAPPQGEGMCCGDKLCPNCKGDDDCQKCQGAGCTGDMNQACCRKNPPQTDCRPFYECP